MRKAERPGWPRIARPWPLLAALLLGASGALGRAEAVIGAAVENKEKAKPKITFPPNVEAKFEKFMAKVKEAKRKLLAERMRKEIEDVAKAAELNPEGVKALETPAQEVVDLCLADWMSKTDAAFRRDLRQPAFVLAQILDQMLAQVEAYTTEDALKGYVGPADHAMWAAALKRTLTPAQSAAWEKVRSDRLEAFQKEMGDFLKARTDTIREHDVKSMVATVADIQFALGLSKERAAELDQLAKNAADKSAAQWRMRAEQTLRQWDDAPRRALLKNRQFYLEPEPDERPDRQSEWKDGLARILSADELQRLEAANEERRLRRLRAIGILMVAEFDDKIAFTAIQRQRLQPLLTRLVGEGRSLFPEDAQQYSVTFSSQSFLAAGATADEREMKEILDPVQWRHWQEVCGRKVPEEDADEDSGPMEQPAGAAAKARGIAEPEDFENAISDFLSEKTAKERTRLLPVMVLKAEDAGRAAGLNADAIARLATAARGAADKTLGDWKSNADQAVRSILQDATAENVRQRLRSIESYNLPRDNGATPEKEMIWTAATKAELSPAQMAQWTKAVGERSAYKNRAIALAALEEFDRRIPLTVEQWEKLEPMTSGIVNEYSAEMSRMFGGPYASRWYMQSYSLFIPFAGLPEKDFKEILRKEQWDRWTGDPEFSNSRMYWGNIRQNHAMRAKAVKQ